MALEQSRSRGSVSVDLRGRRTPEKAMTNYESLIRDNLAAALAQGPEALAERLPGNPDGRGGVAFRAFGADCRVTPDGLLLGDRPETGPRGVVLSLYAAGVGLEDPVLSPMISFRDLPGSMPYQGAFVANTERPLVPRVPEIQRARERILHLLGGLEARPEDTPGDFSLLLDPLPKVSLLYIFYLPDEEFPASVTCLLSHNASRFMPLDGLADTAEQTTRMLLELISEKAG
jgi:hypothetical protein